MRDADGWSAEQLRREDPVAERVRTYFMDFPSGPAPFGIALLAFAGVLGFSLTLKRGVGIECVDTVFLIVIAAVAIRCGLWPSLACAAASALAYGLLFVPRGHEFSVAHPDHLLTGPIFVLAALVASHLAARLRAETLAARQCAATAEALYASSRRIAEITDLDELLQATVQQIATVLDLEAVLLLPDAAGTLVDRARSPAGRRIDVPASGGSGEPAGGTVLLDLRTKDAVVGRARIARRGSDATRTESLLSGEGQKILDAILSQAAVAIERIQLGRERDEACRVAETERLRSALLTALSHDLKTPLASILGAITALRQNRELYDEAARDELESMIQDGAERLSRFVTNLLDMTRLEAGAIIPDRQLVDLGEVVGTSLQVAAPLLERHLVKVDLAPDLPLLELDAGLMEHVLVNLLDNASKYAPADSTVTIRAQRMFDGIAVEVADEGTGLPPGGLEWIFEKFRRAAADGRPSAGTGLGLAICRGFVEALGGRIWAANRSDGPGAVFTIVFPEAFIPAARAGSP